MTTAYNAYKDTLAAMARYREDALARFRTEIGLAEQRAEGVLQRVLGSAPQARVPAVVPDGGGGLDGIVPMVDGWQYLPEEHPDDIAIRADVKAKARAKRISVFFTTIGVVVGVLMFLIGMRSIIAVAIGVSIAGLGAAPLVGRLRPATRAHTAQPGIFLGPDALIVRRNGRLWVFPRERLVRIQEVHRKTPDPIAADQLDYAVTAIEYVGRSGKTESYTLDVQPPGPLEPAIARQEDIRTRRLALMKDWMTRTSGPDRG